MMNSGYKNWGYKTSIFVMLLLSLALDKITNHHCPDYNLVTPMHIMKSNFNVLDKYTPINILKLLLRLF